MNFPNIDSTAFIIFGLSIKWYGIAYAVGFLGGITYAKILSRRFKPLSPNVFEDIILWVAIGTVLGGRLGFVIFYDPNFYVNNLVLIILDIRKGGMSFHGGLIGVILSCYIFSRIKKIDFLSIMDIVSCCVPIGLFFGRLANFVNAELWGKPTSVPWGIIFPDAGLIPRHPSQLYEALLEGIILFFILTYIYSRKNNSKGFTASIFLILYGSFRILCEFFRVPDYHIGYLLADVITMGMVLSIPMILIGTIVLLSISRCQKK